MKSITTNSSIKNVVLLALCQAIAMTSITILDTVAALIGNTLAIDKSLATLPLALLQAVSMVTTIPASVLMQRVGRKFGFSIGHAIAVVGVGLGGMAMWLHNFSLFCLAIAPIGVLTGFAGFYRFAATEVTTEAFRAQAVSLVISGRVIAAVVGPGLAGLSKDWFPSIPFAGSLLPIVGLQILALVLLQKATISTPLATNPHQKGRPLLDIMQQPIFQVSVLGSMVGYGTMVLLMTATPLAMAAVHHPFSASVIQWHVFGMFAPSFFTGWLIARFGVLTIILCGIGLQLSGVVINLSGVGVEYFQIALALLGIGWNFMFVGSTTLLTQAYTSIEKAKTQAIHDFLMFSCVTIATFLSGQILSRLGWIAVNYTAIPGLFVVMGAVFWLCQQHVVRMKQEI